MLFISTFPKGKYRNAFANVLPMNCYEPYRNKYPFFQVFKLEFWSTTRRRFYFNVGVWSIIVQPLDRLNYWLGIGKYTLCFSCCRSIMDNDIHSWQPTKASRRNSHSKVWIFYVRCSFHTIKVMMKIHANLEVL